MRKNQKFIGVLIWVLVLFLFSACTSGSSIPSGDNLDMESSQSESVDVDEEQMELGQTDLVQVQPGQGETGQLESSRIQDAQVGAEPETGKPAGESSSTGQSTENPSEVIGSTCKISIVCHTVLDNMGKLTKGKEEIIPANGIILGEREVELLEGESAFDVLQRVTKAEKMHMEHSKTPLYKSAYIEGIYNLYEFDCGELSGWMYQVNGQFPPYGSSNYPMQNGDVLVWMYTCDLGQDIGGSWDSQNQ